MKWYNQAMVVVLIGKMKKNASRPVVVDCAPVKGIHAHLAYLDFATRKCRDSLTKHKGNKRQTLSLLYTCCILSAIVCTQDEVTSQTHSIKDCCNEIVDFSSHTICNKQVKCSAVPFA